MNKALAVNTVVCGALYGGYFIGLTLLFRRSFELAYRRARARHRLSAGVKHAQSMDPIMRHLHYLLGAVLEKPCRPQTFLFWSGFLMFFMSLVSMKSFHPITALGIGGAGAAIPYLLLRLRLETRRRRGSLEGEKVVSELLRQYRICDKNVYESLERLIVEIGSCKVCRPLLHRMLLRLRNTGNVLEIREEVSMFSFAVGTNWSCMMARCIRLAAERGFDVSLGLEDILIQMGQARERMEQRKRMNSEAMRLTLFMVPLLYASTVLLSIYYLEVPLSKFVQNQVGTPDGMLMLLFIGFLFLVNLAILEIVNNQKLDY